MKFKKVTALALASVMALGFTACGSTTDSKKEEGKKEEASVIEMKFPTFLAGENVGANFFIPQVERFNEKYQGKYKIVIEEVPQAGYADKMKQLAQQKKLPALVHAPGSGGLDAQWFKQVVLENDMAYDLTEFAEEHPEISEKWIPESKKFCTVDGKLVCKPMSVLKPMGLYYNTSMYAPEKNIRDMSVDEFVESLGDNKIAFMTGENAWTTGLLLTSLIANEDGGLELLNNNVEDKLWNYSDPAFVKGVTKLQSLLQNKATSNTVGAAYADAANAFMSKQAAIICNGPWMVGEFAEGSEDKWSNDFNGADVNITIYPGNIAISNPSAYGEFWISNTASDEEKEVAKAFLAFRDSQEEVEALMLAEGGVAPKYTYSDNFLSELEKSPLLYELSQSTNEETKYCAGIGDILPASVGDVEFGKLLPKLIDNTLTPEEFCAELTKKAEEAKQ